MNFNACLQSNLTTNNFKDLSSKELQNTSDYETFLSIS